jgi:hypothetical protein
MYTAEVCLCAFKVDFEGSAWRRRVSELRKHFALRWAGIAVLLLALAFGWQASTVQAQTINVNFYAISPHLSAENVATGAEQLWLHVTKHGEEEIAYFEFKNVGLLPCSISDIYIDDGQLCDLLYIVDSDDPVGGPYGHPDVDFSVKASPGNLPDGNLIDPPFVASRQFNMDSDPPAQPWGINPGQWLGAYYSIAPDKTVYDIEQEILSGELRIGYHVQGFGDGDSGSFVNTPEPASGLLLGLGMLIFLKKSKNKP